MRGAETKQRPRSRSPPPLSSPSSPFLPARHSLPAWVDMCIHTAVDPSCAAPWHATHKESSRALASQIAPSAHAGHPLRTRLRVPTQ